MRIGQTTVALALGLCGIVGVATSGCGNGSTLFFSSAFVNSRLGGGVVPQTPGPEADFLLVRVVNSTTQTVEFIVSIDRDVLVLDDEGNPRRDEDGNLLTEARHETVRLQTAATGDSAESGVLFPCSDSRITRVGLGENLLLTDAAVLVGGEGAGGATGIGVRAESLNALSLAEGDFNCGDTVIFRAIVQTGLAGGIKLQSFLLPGYEQPRDFSGPSTFVNFQQFLETQVSEDD